MVRGEERSGKEEQPHKQPVRPTDPSEGLTALGRELGAIEPRREPQMKSERGGDPHDRDPRKEEQPPQIPGHPRSDAPQWDQHQIVAHPD